MLAIPKCPSCGNDMERKCFMGGSPPIWRCKPCEYKSKPSGSRVLTQAEVLLAKEEAYAQLQADNKVLLEALKEARSYIRGGQEVESVLFNVDAAIAQAEHSEQNPEVHNVSSTPRS